MAATTVITALLWAFFISLTTALALPLSPSTPLTKRCTNALTNPSFESGLPPWMDMVSGSFQQRGCASPGGHSSPTYYFAHANSTVNEANLTLGQSYINLPTGATVECSAWITSKRPTGISKVEVWLDDVSCGKQEFGEGQNGKGWTKIGGQFKVKELGEGDIVGHSVAITVMGDAVASGEGWSVFVDDVVVGEGC